MIGLIGILGCIIILPYLYGSMFTSKDRDNRLLRFPLGLMVELVLWTIVSFPIVFSGGEFSKAVFVFLCCNIPCLIYGVVWLGKLRRSHDVKTSIKREYKSSEQKYVWIIMLLCVFFQVGRVSLFQPSDYRDSKTYNAIVNDIVETNQFFSLYEDNGAERLEEDSVNTKILLSSWYTFEAMLSKVMNVHPLIVINTILPGYLLILHYIVAWYLIGVFIKDEKLLKYMFIILLVLLNEVIGDDISQILLIWPTWGKNITATIVVPLIIVLWENFAKKRDVKSLLGIFLMMGAGCGASNMGIMILPIELALLTITELAAKKKMDLKLILQVAVMMIPVGIFTFLIIR